MLQRSSHAVVIPFQLVAGLILVAVSWPLNWLLDGLRTQLLFFPLWLGYVLTVDGIVFWQHGSSLLTRSRAGFLRLFVVSIAAWWLFELLNLRVANWNYVGREYFSDLEFALLGSLSFSTVIPAVFETADLIYGASWIQRATHGRAFGVTRQLLLRWFMLGLVLLGLLITFPKYCYPLTWISLLFLFEPVCRKLGTRSLLTHLEQGDWRPVISLALGAIICGFFWEMWNYWSYPKWVYSTPGVGVLYLFEMPAVGYLGYLPFGLELYAMTAMTLREPIRIFENR